MFHSFRKFFLATVVSTGILSQANAADFTVRSTPSNTAGTNGLAPQSMSSYVVQVTVTPIAIVPNTTNCQWGYNYDVEYKYNISYSGNIPANASLYTLQAKFYCGTEEFGVDNLPKNISAAKQSGTGRTTRNQWTSTNDCNTATPTSRGCLSGNTTLLIEGPDMPLQTVSRPTAAAPLPVTLVSFDARKTDGGVFLAWTTADEEAGDRYFVERSTDAVTWNSIKTVSSTGKGDYQYTDLEPQAGTNYYRLRNIDAKGEVSYSRILGVKMTPAETQIALFPNPATGDKARVSGIQNPADWQYTISNGTALFVNQMPLTDSEITLSGLPAGLYFVRFTNTKTQESKVIKLVRE